MRRRKRIRGVFTLSKTSGEIYVAHNTPTHEGAFRFLDIITTGSLSELRWYFSFVSPDNFTGYAQTDTLDSHPGWEENIPTWEGSTRRINVVIPGYSSVNISGDTATFSATVPSLVLDAAVDVRGLLVTERYLPTGSPDTLWATGDLESPAFPVVFKTGSISYTVTLDRS